MRCLVRRIAAVGLSAMFLVGVGCQKETVPKKKTAAKKTSSPNSAAKPAPSTKPAATPIADMPAATPPKSGPTGQPPASASRDSSASRSTSVAPPSDGSLRVVTWNVREAFTVKDMQKRAQELRDMATDLRPDVLLLEEVTSIEVVQKIGELMGLGDYYAACSNFVSNTEDHAAFEVGLLSRFPIDEQIEFDPVPDRFSFAGKEQPLLVPPGLHVARINKDEPPRGFLWCRIDAVKLCVSVVHLKSSRGDAGSGDRENAAKRETVAAAVAMRVVQDQKQHPGYTDIVGGDFNVGRTDAAKNGRDLDEDHFGVADPGDRYDETHALLSLGLVQGLRMRNLSDSISESTYVGFEGAGPIDNLYAVGAAAKKFAPAKKSKRAYGSDHFPVSSELPP